MSASNGVVQSLKNVSANSSYVAKISPGWAKYLDPIVTLAGGKVFEFLSSTFIGDRNSRLLQDRGDPSIQGDHIMDITEAYQKVLAAIVTNGLANSGLYSTLQGDLVTSALCAIRTHPKAPIASIGTRFIHQIPPTSKNPRMQNRTIGMNGKSTTQCKVLHTRATVASSRHTLSYS